MKKRSWAGCIDDPKELARMARELAVRMPGGDYDASIQKLVDELPARLQRPVLVQLRRCEGCNAEPGEPCRPGCLDPE